MNPTMPYCNHRNVLHMAFTFNYLAETLIQSNLQKHANSSHVKVMRTFTECRDLETKRVVHVYI